MAQGAQRRRDPGRAALRQAPGQGRPLSGDPHEPAARRHRAKRAAHGGGYSTQPAS